MRFLQITLASCSMSHRYSCCLSSLTLLLVIAAPSTMASALAAAQCPKNLEDILAHVELTEQYEQITFEVSRVGEGDGFSRSERYEPWQEPEQRWILLSQDGETPDDDEREAFAKQRADQGNPLLDYLEGLANNAPELLEQTDNRLRYQFRPREVVVGAGGKNSLDVSKHILGTLTLLNDDAIGCVLTINLSNPKSFSPRTGVKVKTFSLTSRFVLNNETGLFFPETSNLMLKGRAFLVAGFDVINRATYSVVGLRQPEHRPEQEPNPLMSNSNSQP